MSQSAGALENLFFDLSARTKLKLGGADRVRFLNGQISNDLSKATETEAIEATVLTAKGKMDGHIVLTARGDEYLIDADPELREKLRPRLERYAISDDIEMVDVTGEFSIFHVLTKPPAVTGQCQVVASNRFRQAGWDIWVPMNGRDEIFTQLAEAYSFCDDPCMEIFRVERGASRWGRELSEEINPVEADLERSSIDYDKGCYIGQEVISRMKMSGQRNKKLCGFVSVYKVPLQAGMKIFPLGEGSKEAGWITSAVHSKRLGKEIALGYMKRPFFGAGFRLDAIDLESATRSPVRIEVADLPFTAGKPES